MKHISRRTFLARAAAAAASTALLMACGQTARLTDDIPAPPTDAPTPTAPPLPEPSPTPPPAEAPPTEQAAAPTATAEAPAVPTAEPAYLSVVHGSDVAAITKAAVDAIGGMERFVKNGADVIIKPNICTDYYPPEYATTTNPTVIATLVTLAWGAGARRVRVMDTGFGGTAESAYQRSGIGEAVAAAGGEMEVMSPVKFVNTPIPQGINIKEWKVYEDILKADVVINVPIAKHHSMTRLTLSSKNLLGVISNPGGIHANLGQRIADLLSLIRPELTIIDAVRILMANGPTGGNLNDVKQTDTVIASADGVAADAYTTSLFDLKPENIAYIRKAAEMGLGTMDLSTIKLDEFNL